MADILQVGSSINIKRTDGRIHSAIVAAINDDLRCATVEWFEQGETKGKEIDMAAIESLNPDIIILRHGEKPAVQDRTITQAQAQFNKLQRDPTRQSIASSIKQNNGISIKSAHQSRMTLGANNGHTLTSSSEPKESNIPTSRMTAAQNSRRSNVVKEVEKLKKNREERRQRQAEEKAEKEAFMQVL